MNNFGDYIRKKRLELDLTQSEMADKLGISQNFVAYIEKNERNPSKDVIKKLADLFSVPTDKLYLMANPDLEKIFKKNPVNGQLPLPPLLKKLQSDPDLRRKYSIQDEDISMLNSLQPRGQIQRVEDYVFLLMTIRQLFRS